ncbi:hypothetical protein QJQ58_00285 [Paenibacillus dendritiformis]|uniref:hypothetical protein n=1 Tax=Paenibacillus dendritiformis TaxID=130049 RepID=UPI00248CF470|nr:hypothetical protein [Paenibacillus dendritiformis]WGU94754.1 hypothetical protein QJQ58_00285 [Paenibacillus dendritiformis]
MSSFYIKLIAKNAGSIGIVGFVSLKDYETGEYLSLNSSNIIAHNMNVRPGNLNVLFTTGAAPPYYEGPSKGYYIFKFNSDKKKFNLELWNWANTSYGKSYDILISTDNSIYEKIGENTSNGYGGMYSLYFTLPIETMFVKDTDGYKTYKDGWVLFSNDAPSEDDFKKSGIDLEDLELIPESEWAKLNGDIELCYYTDNPNKTEASFNIETEPFTLAEEFDDQTIKIIEYIENPLQEDSTITLETEPFTFYDEVGDSFDVLYYTDDPDKTEAELEISHNYSPLDELDGDFELVTWTMEEEAEVQEELKPIFKEKIEDGDLYGVTVDLSKGTINIK